MISKKVVFSFLMVCMPIVLLVMIELFSLALNEKARPFFYDSSKRVTFDEPYAAYYNALDPHLGYSTKSQNLQQTIQKYLADYKHLELPENFVSQDLEYEHGFSVFRYNADSADAIKIVTLGGSTTDSLIFFGNWPKQLSLLLKEKGIAHTLYNGAMAGYNSFNELTKLTRDVPALGKIDYVLVLDGINDLFEYGSHEKDFPAVHKFQVEKLGLLTGQRLTEYRLLPNSMILLQRIARKISNCLKVEKPKIYLNLGVPVKDRLTFFSNNVKFMQSISQDIGARFFHFIQPINPAQKEYDFKSFFQAFTSLSGQSTTDLSNLLSDKEYFYRDQIHYTEKGSRVLAEKIHQVIFNP